MTSTRRALCLSLSLVVAACARDVPDEGAVADTEALLVPQR
jgi:hypothetical protein